MEQVIIFLIFIGVAAAINAAKKFQEKQQQEHRDSEPKLSRDDLPEATRRMLYGDSAEPQTAQPRSEPGIPVAQPRQAVPPRRVQQQAAPAQRREFVREARPVPQRRVAVARPPEEAPARPVPEALAEAQWQEQEDQRAVRARMQRALQERGQRQAQRKARRPAQAEKPQAEARPQRAARPAAPAPRPQPAARRPLNLVELFGDMHAVRRGIIMQEVLGTPKGLQNL